MGVANPKCQYTKWNWLYNERRKGIAKNLIALKKFSRLWSSNDQGIAAETGRTKKYDLVKITQKTC